MKLVIGLGNPGKKYASSWHNLGFMAIDELRELIGGDKFKKSAKFQADISSANLGDEKLILAKPQTFMNNSGTSVSALANYYKIKLADIIVIHDDLDLPLGKLRIAKNSSAGGHNGIKSIIEHLDGKNFIRIKVGITTELLNKMDSADYVLTSWTKKDSLTVEQQSKKAAEAAITIIRGGIEKAMNIYN